MFDGWTSDPEVAQYMSWEPHKDVSEARDLLNVKVLPNYSLPYYYEWGIIEKESGELIGAIGAKVDHPDSSVVYVGYCLSLKTWGKGIMPEVLSKVVDFLFTVVGFSVIRAKRQEANRKSGRVMEKVGMVRYADGFETVKGKSVAFCYYEIYPFRNK
jgi:RimJ/RimL family protein N-acetyltransferase